jgi:hypothetical protein
MHPQLGPVSVNVGAIFQRLIIARRRGDTCLWNILRTPGDQFRLSQRDGPPRRLELAWLPFSISEAAIRELCSDGLLPRHRSVRHERCGAYSPPVPT